MMHRRPFLAPLVLTTLVGLLALTAPLEAQQGRPFTPDDALSIRSLSVSDMTSDGRWVAATHRTRRDGQGTTDHFRYGDPTYISPSVTNFVLLDTESGEQTPIVDGMVQVRGMEWSPDDRHLAFFMREGQQDGDDYRLYLFDRESGDIDEVELDSDLPIASNSRLEWRPDGSGLLIDLRAADWYERSRAAFLEMTEGPIVVHDGSEPFLDWDRVRNMGRLIRPAMVALNGDTEVLFEEGNWGGINQTEDGQYFAISASEPLKTIYEGGGGSENRLILMEVASKDTSYIVEPDTDRISTNWSPDGTHYLFNDDGHVQLRSIFADSAETLTEAFAGTVSESDTTELRFSAMRWRPDGEAVLVSSQQGWHLLDMQSREMELFYPISEEEEDEGPRRSVIDWSPDGRYLYVSESSRTEWQRGIAVADLETNLWRTQSMERNTLGSWRLSEDGSTMLFEMSDGDSPEELYVAEAGFDISVGDASQLTDMNPWLDEVALTRSELIEYLDVDGESQYGILYYPINYQEGQRYPLVAEVYEDFFDNGFNSNMNLLASQGWFGFRPSVELETGFPGEAWLKAVTTGINSLIDQGMVDGDQLGVHGTSYGGYAVNLLVTQTDRFAAAVNISGKVNMISFLGDSEKITTRNYRAAEAGQDRIGATLWEQPQKYIAHSAVMYADRIDTPLLLLSGEGDWNVPATNQREMYYALRRLGKKVTWVNYMDAGHGAGRAGSEADFHDHWNRMFDWYSTHFAEATKDRPITDGEGSN